MNGKKAKKLRRLARLISANEPAKVQTVYQRLKKVHKKTQGHI
jgi:hypothetical protein